MNKKQIFARFLLGLISLCAVFFNSGAQAAYADTVTCQGYTIIYGSRLAGFCEGTVGGTPILFMSTDPTIYAPTAPDTAVNVYSYQDIQKCLLLPGHPKRRAGV